MPNGGSDCCGTCWFNSSLEGKRGSKNFNRRIPSVCKIRNLELEDPFYTYCANHPYHRPKLDPIPIGPVRKNDWKKGRVLWKPSPDTEEIRQHLIDIIRTPEEHPDESYHFYAAPAWWDAADQLIEWGDHRVITAFQELAQRMEELGNPQERVEETLASIKDRLGIADEPD